MPEGDAAAAKRLLRRGGDGDDHAMEEDEEDDMSCGAHFVSKPVCCVCCYSKVYFTKVPSQQASDIFEARRCLLS